MNIRRYTELQAETYAEASLVNNENLENLDAPTMVMFIKIFMVEHKMQTPKGAFRPAVYRLMAVYDFISLMLNLQPHGITATTELDVARKIISDSLDGLPNSDFKTLFKGVLVPLLADEELSAMHRLQILTVSYLRATTDKEFHESSYHFMSNTILNEPEVYIYSPEEHKHTFRPEEYIDRFAYFHNIYDKDMLDFKTTPRAAVAVTPIVAAAAK